MAATGYNGHQDLGASVSSKLFNSGRPLGSFIDIGNNSESSVQPPIDVQDDSTQRTTVTSASMKASSPSLDAARTPRTFQAEGGDNQDGDRAEYPPSSSRQTSPSVFSASRHPQLLPHSQLSASLDPSTSNSTSNNSSTQSSFDYNANRTAVNHPGPSAAHQNQFIDGISSSSSMALPSSRNGNAGGDSSSYNKHDNGDHANGFAKVSGRRKSVQVFGTDPVGIIGVHKPREIIRLDRDYTSGEICQFWSGFPIELEGRITATQHLNVMNELNAILASAFDPYKAIFDNVVAVLSLYISTWLLSSHYDKEISRFDRALEEANRTLYNPAGLNLINPKKNGYLFLELEYY